MPHKNSEKRRAYNKAWREANHQRIHEQYKARYTKDPSVFRERKLKSFYGLTLEDYDTRLAAQNGVCAACGDKPTKRAFHIDHDHKCCAGDKSCGKCIRGLLCGNCNRALGYAKDDSQRLYMLADYLERTGIE